MFLHGGEPDSRRFGFPRVRGDVPPVHVHIIGKTAFSPRARGCSRNESGADELVLVFPACAGMFLILGICQQPRHRFPRVRGDVP